MNTKDIESRIFTITSEREFNNVSLEIFHYQYNTVEIYKQFEKAGYYLQHFVLDASKMGVPQRRQRVFFIGLRKDLAEPFLYQKDIFTQVPKLNLKFDEPEIPVKVFIKGSK